MIIADSMLGRLARWLRAIGLDVKTVDKPPPRLGKGDVLLTRRSAQAGREGVLFIRYDRLDSQLGQTIDALSLKPDPSLFFTRCLDCNLEVEPISREEAAGLVPEYTQATAAGFSKCPGCGKVFWRGSHTERFEQQLKNILKRTAR